jgi:hypothetical protein
MVVIHPPPIIYVIFTHNWVGVHVQNNVTYLTYIILFTFLLNLQGRVPVRFRVILSVSSNLGLVVII